MVTEPINMVAYSIFSNKGVYALLLGSGISSAAEIPTGWEITLDLIRQIAALEGKDAGDRPDEWFIKTKGQQPDYASLLSVLPGTADERRGVLSRYIEPTPEDRQEGRKMPTKAHAAIAELVEMGYFRVIITTNFDRLLETALQQKGIEPVVISSEDDAKGAPPVTHGRCFIIKVHGDYLDSRIKNTVEELDSYSKEMNTYLDNIFDEFGIIVCGWSGAWDTALRKTIKRCTSRRYTTFWAQKGAMRPEARELTKKRDAKVIEIQSADKFFDDLKEKVQALEDLRRPAPTDIRVATAMVKRYLAEEKYRIRLRDALLDQTKLTTDRISTAGLQFDENWSSEGFEKRIKFYESATEILRSMLAVGSYWSVGPQNTVWPDIIQRLCRCYKSTGGTTGYLNLQHYPAMIAFYAAGISAVAAENYDLLNKLLSVPVQREGRDMETVVERLVPYRFEVDHKAWNIFFQKQNMRFPLSEYLHISIRSDLADIEPDEKLFENYFDKFEMLAALSYGYAQLQKGQSIEWYPSGRYSWKFDRDWDSRDLKAFLDEGHRLQAQWLPIKAGMFGGSYENYKKIREAFDPFVQKVARQSMWG